ALERLHACGAAPARAAAAAGVGRGLRGRAGAVRAAEGPREEAFAADGGRRDDARRDRAARRDHLLPNQVGRRAPTTSATHREKRDRRATALFATLRALVKTRGCAVFRSVNRSSRRWT